MTKTKFQIPGVAAAALCALAVFAARLVWMALWSPYELAGDEAQYWVWSRNLSLSYYSKGPGVAWLIALSCHVFGDTEWAVRFPAALCAMISQFAIAWFARDVTGRWNIGIVAGLLFCLVPGFQATSQLMTIDAPFFTCWILAVRAFWRIQNRCGHPITGWIWLSAALGLGVLFKYTILLLVPGLALAAWRDRRLHGNTATFSVAVLIFAAAVSPIVIWNWQHGWPTISHLLGRAGLPGGDEAVNSWSFSPFWFLELLGSQLGIVGPVLVLMFLGARKDPWSLCNLSALPIFLFYTGLSFVGDVEANWMLAGYLTLLVPAASVIVGDRGRLVRLWTIATIVYGLVAGFGLLFPQTAARLPMVGKFIPLHRIQGHKKLAKHIAEILQTVSLQGSPEPLLIAHHYGPASLLSFYLPGHPPVSSANSLLGGRKSSHDYFYSTRITPQRLGERPVLLVGAPWEVWQRGFVWKEAILLDPTIPVLFITEPDLRKQAPQPRFRKLGTHQGPPRTHPSPEKTHDAF